MRAANEAAMEEPMTPTGSASGGRDVEIESPVVHTGDVLRRIPWGRTLARTPEIAARHHQSMNGAGYRSRLGADEPPLDTRIMTMAAIFDALTAADRPDEKAVPPDKALAFLDAEIMAGKRDRHLFEVLVGAALDKRGV